MSTPTPTTKSATTSRGLTYTYLHVPPQPGQPTLLLLHGFPSTAHDWRHTLPHFAARGLGVLAPDMLGYGGTDKPVDPAAYVGAAQARDLVDLLDAEGAARVVAVGHDWGAMPTAYLAALHQDRFEGFVFLAVGLALARGFKIEQVLPFLKQLFGTEIYGYWDFFNKEEAAGIIEKNLDSLFDLLFVKDTELWKTVMNPVGAIDSFIAEGKRAEVGDFVTEKDREIWRSALEKGGLTAPLNWYKATCRGLHDTDGLDISTDTLRITKPVLYIGGRRDFVCRPEIQEGDFRKTCADLQFEVFEEAGHWMQLEVPGRTNEAIEKWAEVKGLLKPTQ
ncbi:Alpha/Beta hydrolase protein [Schizophyllum fasciatum]